MSPFSRNLFGPFRRLASEWRALREEIRTEAIINGLPRQIQKDIGWPDARAARHAARFGDRGQ